MDHYSRRHEEAFLGFISHDDLYLQYEICQLPVEAFYFESHRKVWQEMTRQYAEGVKDGALPGDEQYVTPANLPPEYTPEAGEIMVTWSGIIANFYDRPDYHYAWPTTLARHLRELHYKRLLHQVANEGLHRSDQKSAYESARELANGVNLVLYEMDRGNTISTPSAGDLWVGIDYQSSGYSAIDNKARGLIRAGMTVLGGRPSQGKTSLARGIVRAQIFMGRNVFWYSKDQHEKQLFELEVATANHMSIDNYLAAGKDPRRREEIIGNAAPIIEAWKHHVAITGKSLDISELVALIQAQHQQRHFDLIVVDHMQLVSVKGVRNAYERVSAVSNALKSLAVDLEVSVLALAQLSRGAVQGQAPTLEDLKNSGDIEQDADQVWLIHRPHYYAMRDGALPVDRETARLVLAKAKIGAIGTVDLEFTPKLAEFSDPTQIAPRYA